MIPEPLPELQLQPSNVCVDYWLPRDDYDPFDLNAPYQRGSVWSTDQRRNLIKSMLMGLPTGSIVMANIGYHKDGPDCRIVDGKQRIEAVRAFINNDFGVPGWWFQPEWCDRGVVEVTYDALTETGSRKFRNGSMPALTFNSTYAWVRNPNFDPKAEEAARRVSGPTPLEARRWIQDPRTEEEMLQAEAELYLLINFGGVAQTKKDRLRALDISNGGSER